mmetsp:Transcript_18046/g.52068  ORF Transcript_18046/g.52068 Transcript_18046/m.52068 type:complete len:214 (-) Transcript_18046:135-776(-)
MDRAELPEVHAVVAAGDREHQDRLGEDGLRDGRVHRPAPMEGACLRGGDRACFRRRGFGQLLEAQEHSLPRRQRARAGSPHPGDGAAAELQLEVLEVRRPPRCRPALVSACAHHALVRANCSARRHLGLVDQLLATAGGRAPELALIAWAPLPCDGSVLHARSPREAGDCRAGQDAAPVVRTERYSVKIARQRKRRTPCRVDDRPGVFSGTRP